MAKIRVTQDNTTVVVGDGDTVVIDIEGGGTVTIVADPNDNVDNFNIEYGDDSESDTANVDLSTFSEDGLHINIKDYDQSDQLNLVGGTNYSVDPNNTDELQFDYVGSDGQDYSGSVHAKDGSEKDFTSDPPPIIICFTAGTIIDTDLGPRPVESLMVGDLVATQDHGLQPVRWIGKRHLDSVELARSPHLYPIRVRQGALGDDLPYRDLVLSPQHRVQLSDWRAEYLFAEPKVLVAVKHLVNGKDITVETKMDSVRYYHLLFDQHEILTANGAPAESLHSGDVALGAIGSAVQTEIADLFPDLAVSLLTRSTAQPVLKSYEARAVSTYAA